MRLDYLTRRFASAARQPLSTADNRLAAAAAKLDALSPLKVLKRGFAIGYGADGQMLHSVEQVSPGDDIRLQLADGLVACRVNEVQEERT